MPPSQTVGWIDATRYRSSFRHFLPNGNRGSRTDFAPPFLRRPIEGDAAIPSPTVAHDVDRDHQEQEPTPDKVDEEIAEAQDLEAGGQKHQRQHGDADPEHRASPA